MTHRMARRILGSRTGRRSNTKTRCFAGSKVAKRIPKYRHRSQRQVLGKPRLAVLVRRRMAQEAAK